MKILLSGSMSSSYPMRRYLKSLDNPNIQLIKRLPTQEYYDYIAKFVCSFTCCLNPNSPYIVGNLFSWTRFILYCFSILEEIGL